MSVVLFCFLFLFLFLLTVCIFKQFLESVDNTNKLKLQGRSNFILDKGGNLRIVKQGNKLLKAGESA